MKKLLLFALTIFVIGCTNQNEKTIEKTIENLTKNSVITYSTKVVTIQPRQELNDTVVFTKDITTTIKKIESDTIFNYRYHAIHNYNHPVLQIPCHYEIFTDSLKRYSYSNWFEGEDLKSKNISDLDNNQLQEDLTGGLPDILDIINLNSYKFISYKDTVINKTSLLVLNTTKHDSIRCEIFIDKKNNLPHLFRYIENPRGTYIIEYHYSNFKYKDSIKRPDFLDKTLSSKKIKRLSVGEPFPLLEVGNINCENTPETVFKGKTTVIINTAIFCGACNRAIPDIKLLNNKYKQINDIKIYAFYPIDSGNVLLKYVTSRDIDYPVLFCANEESKNKALKLLTTCFPTTYIIDRNGNIALHKESYCEDWLKIIEDEIEKAKNIIQH